MAPRKQNVDKDGQAALPPAGTEPPAEPSAEVAVVASAEQPDPAEPKAPAVAARKLNRGTVRRIKRGAAAFDAAVKALVKELDPQVYVTDEAGERVGRWPLLIHAEQLAAELSRQADEIVTGE